MFAWYFEAITAVFFLFILCKLTGLLFVDLIPEKINRTYRQFLSPTIGLATLIIIVSLHGKFFPFYRWLCLAEIGAISVLIVTYSLKRNYFPALKEIASLFFLTVIVTTAIFGTEMLKNTLITENDSITYLIHSQWLQHGFFGNLIHDEPFYPALNQVYQYQIGANVGRMGSSFFMAWVQAVTGFAWSYKVYPIVVILSLLAGSMAAGGIIKVLVPTRPNMVALAVVVIGTTLNGLAVGAGSGYYTQTQGLAFVIAFLALFIAYFDGSIKITFFSLLPLSLCSCGLILCYPEFLPIFSLCFSLLFCFYFISPKFASRQDVFNYFGTILLQTLVLSSFQLSYMYRGLRRAVDTFVVHNTGVGYSVKFSLGEFLLQGLGLISPLCQYIYTLPYSHISLYATALLFCIVLFYFLSRTSLKLVLPLILLISMTLSLFVKCRYFSTPLVGGDIGQTYLQWKAVKWGSPFILVLILTAFAYFSNRNKFTYILTSLCLMTFISYGTVCNITRYIMLPVFETCPSYSQMIELRNIIAASGTDKPVYLDKTPAAFFGSIHHTISYFLSDFQLVGNWMRENELFQNMSSNADKCISIDKGCIVVVGKSRNLIWKSGDTVQGK